MPIILGIIILVIHVCIHDAWIKLLGRGSVGKFQIPLHFSALLWILIIAFFIFGFLVWLIELFAWHLLWGVPLVLSGVIGLWSIGAWMCLAVKNNRRWQSSSQLVVGWFRRRENKKREKSKSMSAKELNKHKDGLGGYGDTIAIIVVLLSPLIVYLLLFLLVD